MAQEGKWKISGKVKNETGNTLSPASVFVSNSTKGAIEMCFHLPT